MGLGHPCRTCAGTTPRELDSGGPAIDAGSRVLEIGCGTGFFTEKFAAAGPRIFAVDISPELIAKARGRNLPPAQVTLCEKRFEECDAEGPFDAITPFDWLHPVTPQPLIGLVTAIGRAIESVPVVREFAGSLYIKATLPRL